MNLVTSIAVLVVLTLFCCLWLWFMIRRPEWWSAIVDRENDFWRGKGIISAAFAERMKRLEKGRMAKIIIGGTAVLGAIGLAVLIALTMIAESHQDRKIRFPLNPPVQQKPAPRLHARVVDAGLKPSNQG
jgi:hypothetical protein